MICEIVVDICKEESSALEKENPLVHSKSKRLIHFEYKMMIVSAEASLSQEGR